MSETTPEPEETEAVSDPPAEVEPDKEARRDERYRVQLRHTEAERDSLRAALVPHVRAAVEQRAAERLADGSSIWVLSDLDPMTMLGDDYVVDAEKVDAAVDRLLAHAPKLAQRAPSFDGGPRGDSPLSVPGWDRLLKRQGE